MAPGHIVEGSTKLLAIAPNERGPGTRTENPFYNPAMQLNRDLSVALVAAYARQRGRSIDVADVLAGTGARTLRLANEISGDITVHANDAHDAAIAAVQAGAKLNDVEARVRTSHDDAHRFLASRNFDVVDIDPYGSPMPFLDAGIRATRHAGLLCITATDTAALCGRYPRVARRRYGAEHGLHKFVWRAEVGLRILAAAAIQAAGRFDRAATPILSVAQGHWMRIVVRLEDGKGKADALAKQVGPMHVVNERPVWGRGPADAPHANPVWQGPLHDKAWVTAMQADASLPILDILAQEAESAPFWYNLADLQGKWGDGVRKVALYDAMREADSPLSPTHIDPQGIRTRDDHALFATWESLRN